MNFTRMIGSLLIICILFLIVAVVWLNTTSRSVLWSYREQGAVSRLPVLAIFNPFRERKVEEMSEEVLRSIRNGNCREVVSELGASDRYESLCENLMADGLDDWKLVFREDKANMVSLFYRVKRVSSEGYDSELGVTFNSENEQQRLVDIGTIY